MKLIKLTMDHFKGIQHFEMRLDGCDATVYGDNATGKTTLYDAFLWLLFGKDSTDRKDFEIQPLGADGKNAQSGVETSVSAVLEKEDGSTVTLYCLYMGDDTMTSDVAVKRVKFSASSYSGDALVIATSGEPSHRAKLIQSDALDLGMFIGALYKTDSSGNLMPVEGYTKNAANEWVAI